MRLFLALALAAALVFTTASAQTQRPAECLFVTMGREFIRGECLFSPIDKQGSFQIMSMDGSIFAQVLIYEPGLGSGYWNGIDGGTRAHTSLGDLVRDDACWVNDQATICAW